MSLHVRALASGSSGNAFLIRSSTSAVVLEAGLSARVLERQLQRYGVEPGGLAAIVVSHEHHDHARGAGPLARRFGAAVICNAPTAAALAPALAGVDVRMLHADGVSVGDVDLWSFAVPHDAAAPVGVLLRHDGHTVGLALDCGHAQPQMVDALREADLVVVEANHDREILLATAYPWSTKHRIMGAQGHLSNMQAAELLHKVAADGKRRDVWLAHLSERANDRPAGVIKRVGDYLEIMGGAPLKLDVALRDQPSVSWSSDLALRQVSLFPYEL